ncbi:MAG TPA: hypothetical protein VEB43_11060 [Anaeromyxobacter sp.]|nr:hypothetical protein [Anaeromyxobacter sp.]
MKTVALKGGVFLSELGPASDVDAFFQSIRAFVSEPTTLGLDLLLDRLYRRYLTAEQLPRAAALMQHVEARFASLSANVLHQVGLGKMTRLQTGHGTLADVFAPFFETFRECAESASETAAACTDLPDFEYLPVRLIRSEEPWFSVDDDRPLAEYDRLEGEPFWKE